MKKVIIQTTSFAKKVDKLLEKKKLLFVDFEDFKKELSQNPEDGDLVSGTGGVRKVRLKSSSKGKSGGKVSKIFKDLKKGLEEVIAHKKGKIVLRSEVIEIPEPPMAYKAKDVKNIRERRRYSQSVFAKVLNVSVKTVQSWESGKRVPSSVALRLLEIVDKGIYKP